LKKEEKKAAVSIVNYSVMAILLEAGKGEKTPINNATES